MEKKLPQGHGKMQKNKLDIYGVIRPAIRKGDLSTLVEILGDDPARLQIVDTTFGGWLHMAASHGKLEIVRWLVSQGCDMNALGGVGPRRPINEAASNGHLEVVKFLIDSGALLDTSDSLLNPLFSAIGGDISDAQTTIVKLLIDSDIDAEVKYSGKYRTNWDALAFAKEMGRADIAILLGKHLGIDVEAQLESKCQREERIRKCMTDEDIRPLAADAIRKAKAQIDEKCGNAPLFGFALGTDDDVCGMYHIACTTGWVAEKEKSYPNIGYNFVDWIESGDQTLFDDVNTIMRQSAERDYEGDNGWADIRDRRFELLVLALADCREAGVFDDQTFLCVGSTDPCDHLRALEMDAVDRLNLPEVADKFAAALGYERYRKK
ncbi:MAG: DUF4303 domain-containing protein [Planctomycetia bacterium]